MVTETVKGGLERTQRSRDDRVAPDTEADQTDERIRTN